MFVGMQNRLYVLITLIGLIFSQSLHASAQQDTAIYSQFEIAPTPVGGKLAYLRWLEAAIEYPDSALTADVQGELMVEFVVERTGELSHIYMRDTLGFGVGEAVRKAIATSPPWNVAIINGRPVRARYQLPVAVNVRQAKARQQRAPVSNAKQDTAMLDAAMLEVMPEPPGGLQAFMQWVGSNYRFPHEAIDNDVHGTLQMGFIVEADGTITHVEVLNDLGHGTGAEAVRVLKHSPRWKPGIVNGKPVRVRFKLPIKLALQGES